MKFLYYGMAAVFAINVPLAFFTTAPQWLVALLFAMAAIESIRDALKAS